MATKMLSWNDTNKGDIPTEHAEVAGKEEDLIKQAYPGVNIGAQEVQITASHKEYLTRRHGTCELDPLPSEDPADPYNWPRWRVNVNLVLISFHALMIGFMTGGLIPAFGALAEEFDVSLNAAVYTTSTQILFLGIAPLFWGPLAERYGRRPVWLISTLLSMACNLGCALAKTYPQLLVARIFQSIFNSPAGAIGGAVVVDLFFAHERARKMGIWTLMVTIGNPLGPFLMGFVATRAGWRWIFWIFTVINGIQFLCYFFFSPETKYIREYDNAAATPVTTDKTITGRYMSFGKIEGTTPLRHQDFYRPLTILSCLSVAIPTLAHSVMFCFCSVLICVEIPGLLGVKFNLNFESIGLNFMSNIIGGVIGELAGGPLLDYFRNRRGRSGKTARSMAPEHHLHLSYPAYALCIAGFVVFLVTLDQADVGRWNIRPDVGLAVCAAGNQMMTTVLFTYAIERNLDNASNVGVALIMVRQIWSFIGPFWFPYMFDSTGLRGAAALCSGIMLAFAVAPTALQQIWIGPRYA
ncbi:uncharacterized protein A1O9_06384 [Exophiala aquamarina CBS 119918]|uniref:Major facilitator superfamily (MFS) profile domain-containing protein n=1 Tax=Exophiala aquamarina CBS 119918 TaxID=1182545 RepID=A0A072PGM6_9EURO|nr:uncharacterized protein A1O9_06384 [Exophiala aquamarina CBS 119918]KEF58458.1 hypothetical protein A1O9_06384 [Exophiala aquamarina CBS 119918]